jgi:4-hydroxy-L-threonine phosphate dehydrogenase PdxA
MTSTEHELIKELIKCLSWYVENDGEENAYWLEGKKEAEDIIKKANTFIIESEILKYDHPINETLRDKLIRCGWVTNFNADTLVKLIKTHYKNLASNKLSDTVINNLEKKHWENTGVEEQGRKESLFNYSKFAKSIAALIIQEQL